MMWSASLWGYPAPFSQVLSLNPVVSTTRSLPSQCPTEKPIHNGSASSGRLRPSIQTVTESVYRFVEYDDPRRGLQKFDRIASDAVDMRQAGRLTSKSGIGADGAVAFQFRGVGIESGLALRRQRSDRPLDAQPASHSAEPKSGKIARVEGRLRFSRSGPGQTLAHAWRPRTRAQSRARPIRSTCSQKEPNAYAFVA